MALALSLSLDLFLMKGNLLIAVKAQPGDKQGRKTAEQAQERWRKRKQKEKKRIEHRGMVNVVTKKETGEIQRALTSCPDKWSQQHYITHKQ